MLAIGSRALALVMIYQSLIRDSSDPGLAAFFPQAKFSTAPLRRWSIYTLVRARI